MTTEERQRKAIELFEKGYNCSQSVSLAFADIIEDKCGADFRQIEALSGGFGGGVGRLREICGCVCGMAFVAGAVKPIKDGDAIAKKENYTLVQELATEFRKGNGAIVCRELLKGRTAAANDISPAPEKRTAQYYAARPCKTLVESAVGILAGKLSKDL